MANRGATFEFQYPTVADNVDKLIIGLTCTRAADDIRVSYDYDRDGWKVEQASIFQWDIDDEICDPGWKEAAFIPAWQFQTDED